MSRRLTDLERLDRTVSEDALLTAIIGWLRHNRWLAVHHRNSKAGILQGDRGVPDILAAKPPRLVLIETKRETEKLEPPQEVWRAALEACPGIEYHVFRPSDWRTGVVERVLGGGDVEANG